MEMMTIEKSEEYIARLYLYKRLNSDGLEKYEKLYSNLYYDFLRDKNIDFTYGIFVDKLSFIVFERMNLFNVLTKEEKEQYEKLVAEEKEQYEKRVAEENYYNDVPF